MIAPISRLIAALALAVGVTTVPISTVAACSCAAMAPAEAAGLADAVFSGTVVAAAVDPDVGGGMDLPSSHYQFAVDGVAKGDVAGEVTVTAGGNDGMCGIGFGIDERWLIFARADGGGLRTDLCAGNTPLGPDDEPPLPMRAPTSASVGESVTGPPMEIVLPVLAVVGLVAVSGYLFWRAERVR